MKKVLIGIGAVIVIAAIAIAVTHGGKKTADSSSSATKASNKQIDACKVLTLDKAKNLIGVAATASDNNSLGTASSSTANVSTCSYGNNATTVSDIQTVTILTRTSDSSQGDSAKTAFNGAKPSDAQAVSGYGDDAYWSPTIGQLNVVKGNTWLIITGGLSRPSDRTLDFAKKVADVTVKDL